ncbi:unnamed protein product [Clonostachys chloroleuca]|uniref:Uncharacterized protein n=1 Tax=Clonostachys chloroleuca TaxID=1926264 RepID=A0AA35PXE4_9HYPO|nr:unnamed protein product [Clonostachys chloroleuca]
MCYKEAFTAFNQLEIDIILILNITMSSAEVKKSTSDVQDVLPPNTDDEPNLKASIQADSYIERNNLCY